LPLTGAEVTSFAKANEMPLEKLGINSVVLRAMKDKGLLGCSCFKAYESAINKFTWSGDGTSTLSKEYEGKAVYSINELFKLLQVNAATMEAVKASLAKELADGKTLTYTAVMDKLLAFSRIETKSGDNASNIEVLKSAGILA